MRRVDDEGSRNGVSSRSAVAARFQSASTSSSSPIGDHSPPVGVRVKIQSHQIHITHSMRAARFNQITVRSSMLCFPHARRLPRCRHHHAATPSPSRRCSCCLLHTTAEITRIHYIHTHIQQRLPAHHQHQHQTYSHI